MKRKEVLIKNDQLDQQRRQGYVNHGKSLEQRQAQANLERQAKIRRKKLDDILKKAEKQETVKRISRQNEYKRRHLQKRIQADQARTENLMYAPTRFCLPF